MSPSSLAVAARLALVAVAVSAAAGTAEAKEKEPAKVLVTPAEAGEMCRTMTPSAALRLFVGNKQLRLGYLTHDMEVWSTTRAHGTKSQARFDEEVLVLARRAASGGVVVSGAGVTYEVLRWDGTCASLMGDELTFKRAPQPVRPVQIDRLHLPLQTKLAADGPLHAASERADAACRADAKAVACDVAKRAFGSVLVMRAPKLAL